VIRIGCASWSIASRQAGLFGEGDSTLSRYATRFSVVEVNSTFHRRHQPETFVRWAAAVPRTFRFSVKLPKTITHEARLVRSAPAIREFARDIAGLGAKLGGVLVQLPPSLALDARVAGAFFRNLRAAFEVPIACEPRHASWFEPKADALWERFDIARVAADPPIVVDQDTPGRAGRWRYFRLHGAPRMYYSAYDDARLATLATALLEQDRVRRAVWCIFDNTAHSHAVEDAARLQALVGLRAATKPTR